MREHPQPRGARDHPASAFLPEGADRFERAMCDVEVEAGLLDRPATVDYLDTRLRAVEGADAHGDDDALRAELVNLAAAAIEWVVRLPAPRRGYGRKAA